MKGRGEKKRLRGEEKRTGRQELDLELRTPQKGLGEGRDEGKGGGEEGGGRREREGGG